MSESETTTMTEPKRIRVTFDVATQSQEAELHAVWQEIVAGKYVRLNTAAEDLNEIMDRARPALQRMQRDRRHLDCSLFRFPALDLP